MKDLSILRTLTQRTIFVVFVSMLLALQTESAFSQTTETFTTLQNQRTDAKDYDCVFPPEWNSVFSAATTPHLIIIEEGAPLTINGIRVNTCDYVGCFYEDDNGNLKCGAANFLVQGESIPFLVFGDDPDTPEKDGFSYAETIHFRFFSWPCAGGKTIDVETIIFDTISYQTTNKWYPLGQSEITSMTAFTEIDCQIAATDSGKEKVSFTFKKGWNTFTCAGNEQDTKKIMSLLGGRLIVIKEVKGTGIIWPEQGISTISGFLQGKDYMIKVSEDCDVCFSR
jgi:hypothetical protein